MDRLERAAVLDPVAQLVSGRVRALPLGPWRDVLHGRWLGHPAHPVLVEVPIGTWLSAAVLDCLPKQRPAAAVLISVGIGAAVPTALSGWVDWAEQGPRQKRVGLVHAAVNGAAVLLYGASLIARVRGRSGRGKVLGFAGLAVVGIGSALGGHLAYRQASGANHAEAVTSLVRAGWQHIGDLTDFEVGRPVRRYVDDVPVVIVREVGDEVRVLADSCSHRGGPLSEGTVRDGCVHCPWHGSVFRLADGWNVRGPATAPQPAFETRLDGARVEARLRNSELAQ
ncbi:Rieske 2Fe-2S domain-containing protein [Streptomyces sp. NPDC057287]|uniref:Rieske 2Fe-2S domain-containing protein n=1 Tax=Streptomyces sp. NPDC057287 TaxID=3346086 RepID=UPI0036261CF2